MKFKDYWFSLNADDKMEYAEKSGTTVTYIRHHYMVPDRRPTPDRLKTMVKATNGKVSRKEMIAHFADKYDYFNERN